MSLFLFHHLARKTTMSTRGRITITRGCNGPSTRVPCVMLITSFGSHVSSCVCASFAVLGTLGQSLHASEVGCANSGSAVGLCSDLSFMVQVSIFLHAVVGLQASPRLSAVGALSPSREILGARSTADRQATCQVASMQASTSTYESTKVCVPLAHDFELLDLLARKVVLWITPSGGKDAQTAVRRAPPGRVGRGSI